MASQISELSAILKGTHYIDATIGYHAARAALNGNRKATTHRRYEAIKTALHPYNVMVSLNEDGSIRVLRPDTKQIFTFKV